MSIQPDYKMLFITLVRGRDVELSEDLYRRIGTCITVAQLSQFIHGIIAQYRGDTLSLRAALPLTDNYDQWITSFSANVLPYMIKHRLPSCTDKAAEPQYQCESKAIL